MSDDESIEAVMRRIAERGAALESAERAIVDAADKWQRTRDDLGAEFEGDSELAAAVDAWRKLKGM